MSDKEKTIQELLNFGIINIDKPTGPTSFSISDYIRKALNLSKTSHFGTLDPMVTGVLPVALSRACRLNEYFMHHDKVYVGIMRIHEDIDEEELKKKMEKFIGVIKQMPPVRSRVKRAIREREVKKFEIIEKDGKDVLFYSDVEAGTYIRTLCDSVGKEIGGAHMLELRRVRACVFEEKDSIRLYDFDIAVEEYKKGNEELLKKIIIPAEVALKDVVDFVDEEMGAKLLKQLLTGKPLIKGDIQKVPTGNIFALFFGGRLIGVYRKKEEGDIIAKPEFVFNYSDGN